MKISAFEGCSYQVELSTTHYIRAMVAQGKN